MADYKFKKGFDINISGKAELKLVTLDAPKKAAVQPAEFLGLKPKMEVNEGDIVKIGTPLFSDKFNESIKFTSPVSGKVAEINRGERRRLMEIVIENDMKNDAVKFKTVQPDGLARLSREEIIENMLKSGVWPAIRTRPFNKIANPAEAPRDIFISGMDTAPLAADLDFIMQGLDNEFQMGIDVLAKLTEGKIYLGINGKSSNETSVFRKAQNVEKNTFSGPHPAGNIGVQIHHIKPIKSGEKVW